MLANQFSLGHKRVLGRDVGRDPPLCGSESGCRSQQVPDTRRGSEHRDVRLTLSIKVRRQWTITVGSPLARDELSIRALQQIPNACRWPKYSNSIF